MMNAGLHRYFIIQLIFLFTWVMATRDVDAQSPVFNSYAPQYDNKVIKINTVYSINNGYILCGTTAGLYTFDGQHFANIPFANKDFTDTITAIYQDSKKNIWVGFLNGRLAHVVNNQLIYYNPEEGTPQKKITAILEDTHRRIWYASYGEGIYYIDNGRHYLVNEENGLTDANINTLAAAPDGSMIATSDQGLQVCRLINKKALVTNIGPAQGLPDYLVTAIEHAGQNTFWIGLQDKGFCFFDNSTGKIVVPNMVQPWKYGQVNNLMLEKGMLWIATSNGGVFKYNIAGNKFRKMMNVDFPVQQLLKDIQGNLWLLSPDNGLTRTEALELEIHNLYRPDFFETIHAILATRNGDIWINGDGIVHRYSKDDEQFTEKKYTIPGLRFSSDITALYEGPDSNIWIGTMGQGVYILNPATGNLQHADGNPLFRNASILSISGMGKTVFICSLQGAASVELDGSQVELYFNKLPNVNTGVNFIFSIYKDSKGRVWYATDGMGLLMEKNGNFQFFNDENVIGDKHIYSITEDNQGRIWFSTGSAGIYCLEDEKTITHFGIKEGLSTLNISVIKKINSGHIVAVNKNGLDIIDPATLLVTYRNKQTGLPQVNAHNPGAVTLDRAGNLLFATNLGIGSFSTPGNVVEKPKTIIESVQLYLNSLDTNVWNRFAHDENNLTFNFKGLYFTDPQQVYYRYKLEGLDSNWVATTDLFKIFPRLDPGKYNFRIQSALNAAFLNASEANYNFTITQAFYKTAWFIALIILIGAGILFWYIKKREIELKKIATLQQEKMNYRFEVLRNQVNPHFLFNSFNTLISSIEEDPAMAIAYTEELSDFFRNILTYRDKEIIPIHEEISLLKNYFFLQQKRYGNCLNFVNKLPSTMDTDYFLPPLTLQLLAENAIKHNVVSETRQLVFSVSLDGEGNLVASNNKNMRKSFAAGTGMGLQNIAGRFKILTGKTINVQDEENTFIVKLPLIKTSHA